MDVPKSQSPYTYLGILLVVLGGPLVLLAFKALAPEGPMTNTFVILREFSFFLLTGVLFLIISQGEKLGIDSIGLHNKHWGKTILWSILGYIISIAAALLCILILKWAGVPDRSPLNRYENVSVGVMTLMYFRAGFVEEIFFRGYLMERLEKISGKWVVYFLLPAVIFGLLHASGGIRGIVIAFVLGLVFAFMYWKNRDLKANIIAHFLVDFISNVIMSPPS
jgi:membrane protease YdiL (CAAX protease family)